jgi:hypothetical protein
MGSHRWPVRVAWTCLLAFAATAVAPARAEAGAITDDPALRSALAWQIALDRVGFSPGIVDGKVGPKAELATREFQKANNLPAAGKLDPQTAAALEVAPDRVLATADGAPTASERLGHQEFILTYKHFEPIAPACLPH